MGEGDKVAGHSDLCQPVLASESLDAIELAKIARHHGQPATTSVTSDQQIVTADRLAPPFKMARMSAV